MKLIGETEVLGENPVSVSLFFNHKSHVGWPGIEHLTSL